MHKHISDFQDKELIGKKVSFVYGPGEHPGLDFNYNIGIIDSIKRTKFGAQAKVLMIRGEETGNFDWINGVHIGWNDSEGIGCYIH
jgi:hypothetical protein